MKALKLFVTTMLFSSMTFAQTNPTLYGLVRKNYFSTVTDPFDSTITYQQFDSATIRLGNIDPIIGFVDNVSGATYNMAVNLTGAALNPYDNSFVFMGGNGINTFDLGSGLITNSVPIFNPIATSYFDNYRFNNSDSTMYGLARRNIYDPVTMTYTGEVYLAKANTQTGLITQISSTSVGQGFALAGSAIDPYQMVFYYSTGANLVGLDLYNGGIFSNPAINVSSGTYFDNFTYSCADTSIYGLIRQNYYSYVPDPFFPGDSIQVFDSCEVRLGKIDPFTGVVTTISPVPLSLGGYSLNTGSAIDPVSMTFFYSNGYEVIGASLITGLKTSSQPFSFADGDYFDLMRNFDNCINANPIRLNPATVGVNNIPERNQMQVYPNPTDGHIIISSSDKLKSITVYDAYGKEIVFIENAQPENNIDLSKFSKGLYFIKSTDVNGTESKQKVILN